MCGENKKEFRLDIPSLKPIGEAAKILTESSVNGVGKFLSLICLPAAEEFGLLLKDVVHKWRNANIIRIIQKAELKHSENEIPKHYTAHPKLVAKIIEYGSWEDDLFVQDMWAGLLVSSCSIDGKEDSNKIFINKLSSMTTMQANIINYACKNSDKFINKQKLIFSGELKVSAESLYEITNCQDIERIDRELDSLRQSQLIHGGFDTNNPGDANISPTPLALHMFARCSGGANSVLDFYNLTDSEPVNPYTLETLKKEKEKTLPDKQN